VEEPVDESSKDEESSLLLLLLLLLSSSLPLDSAVIATAALPRPSRVALPR
jgi:hypothetical protein